MRKRREWMIWFLAVCLSYGFIMEFQWPWLAKKENQKKVEKKPSTEVSKPSASSEESKRLKEAKKPSVPASEFFQKESKTRSSDKGTNEEQQQVSVSALKELPVGGLPGLSPEDQEVAKIQENLKKIAAQSKKIEVQNQNDRVKLQKIVEQAKIQGQLMESLKVPKINSAKNVINTEEVLRATKVRLIAEDVKRTQVTLKNIQPIKSVPQTVKITQIPKVAKKVQSQT